MAAAKRELQSLWARVFAWLRLLFRPAATMARMLMDIVIASQMIFVKIIVIGVMLTIALTLFGQHKVLAARNACRPWRGRLETREIQSASRWCARIGRGP
ncbi:hypothetical protein [Bradyrhizobium sp. UFLA05-112]